MAGRLHEVAARRHQQPGVRPIGNAALRPDAKGRSQRLRQSVFRRRHVPRAGGEKGDQLAIGLTRHLFGGASGIGGHCRLTSAGAGAPRPSPCRRSERGSPIPARCPYQGPRSDRSRRAVPCPPDRDRPGHRGPRLCGAGSCRSRGPSGRRRRS
ncbi:hypothetical protein RHECNPAF_770065 [Rhizobium etli CNPAF512]|nr:hypothetical protein RHECNPAF_770065 [Rhizobium etli CNPAF512]